MEEPQPGQVITPGGATVLPPAQLPQAEQSPLDASQQPAPLPVVPSELPKATEPEAMVPQQGIEQPQPQAVSSPALMPDSVPSATFDAGMPAGGLETAESDQQQTAMVEAELSWNAAEFIHPEKGPGWYLLYVFGVLAVSILVFVFTRDFISSGAVLIAGLGLIYVLARKPHEQLYMLHDGQLAIGRKWYHLHDFKAFSTQEETEAIGVTLVPLKRFMPPVTIYLDKADPQPVLTYLLQYLPQTQIKPDAVDKMLTRLRF